MSAPDVGATAVPPFAGRSSYPGAAHGGAVILIGDEGLNTLYHLRFRSIYPAERGRHGEGSNKTGRSGKDLEIKVPPGTQVFDSEDSTLVGEILDHGERLVVAAGGRGGRGNARFATSTNRAPERADPGEEGVERRLRLELKLLADVGVVGLPNAGKSTLISVISAARPRIADYPFTTLVPQLGVVADGPTDAPFVVADLPGLIEGASQGAGLGHQFLRHVERCRVLLHLVDLAAEGGSAEEDLSTIEHEMEAFDPELLKRPRWIVGTKLDSVREERRESLRAAAAERGLRLLEISSVRQEGVRELVNGLRRMLAEVADK
jgi:GTP-binding protein